MRKKRRNCFIMRVGVKCVDLFKTYPQQIRFENARIELMELCLTIMCTIYLRCSTCNIIV